MNVVTAFAGTAPAVANDKAAEEVADVKDADNQVAVATEEDELEEEQE
jgi:hypothetical protein